MPKNDRVGHFGAPWRPFWILQAVRRCRRLASAPFAARLVLIQNLLDQIFLDPNFCLDSKLCWPKTFWTNIFLTQIFLDPKFFGPKFFLDPKLFWTQSFGTKLFLDQNLWFFPTFLAQIFWIKILLILFYQHFLSPKIWTKKTTTNLNSNIIWPKILFGEKIFAKLSLNSTQSQLNLRLRWSLFPFDPATHPPTHPPAGKV